MPAVKIQPSCRCPATHPRVKPLETRYCIKNGVVDHTEDKVLRLNNNSHPLPYINDGYTTTMWVSGFQNDVTIDVELGDQFEVQIVKTKLLTNINLI